MSDTAVIEGKGTEDQKLEHKKIEENVVENKRKTLEDYLKEKSIITFDDKVWNVKQNIKNPEVWFPLAALTHLSTGIASAYCGWNQVMTALLISIGGVGTVFSCGLIPDYIKGRVLEDYLANKKEFGKNVDEILPELLDSLDLNPEKEVVYDFIQVIKKHVEKPEQLLNIISSINVSSVEGKKYEPLFKVMIKTPEKYNSHEKIIEAIREYDRAEMEKEWQETRRLIDLKPEKKGSLEYFDLPNTQKIYLHLLSAGWNPSNITQALSRMPKKTFEREIFLDYLIKSEHEEKFFLDLLKAYNSLPWSMNEGKKLAIIQYLFEKKEKQLTNRLAEQSFSYKIESKIVLKYLNDIDCLPSVGIKGQINTLIKLNDVMKVIENYLRPSYHLHKQMLEDFDSSLERLLTTDYSSVDESIIGVIQFLRRHPNIDFGEVFPKVFKYHMFTEGRAFKSDWMKKEVTKVPLGKPEEQPRPEIEGLLNAKGERKFLEELDRKVELARFEAFNRAIEDVYYAPLDNLFGKKVSRTITVTEETLNVVAYFNDPRGIFKEELEGLLRSYFEDPSKVQEYIDNLPGNKSLEGKVKGLQEWNQGLTKTYDVNVSGKLKEKLEEETQSEYRNLLKCAEQLEAKIEVPKDEDVLTKAEHIFEELSKLKIPQEKQYLILEAKHHLTKLKSQAGILSMNSQKVTFYDSKNPIESMNMGVVSNSCTNITGGANDFASVANTIDNNKKVIYMSADKKVGRTLAILTNKGIVTYQKYDSTNLETDEAWVDYFHNYAKQVGAPLIVPKRFATEGITKALKARGAKLRVARPTLHKAVCNKWYDDQSWGRVDVHSGYTFTVEAYILK